GEVDQLDDAINQRVAQRNQGEQGAVGEAQNQHLNEDLRVVHRHPGSAAIGRAGARPPPPSVPIDCAGKVGRGARRPPPSVASDEAAGVWRGYTKRYHPRSTASRPPAARVFSRPSSWSGTGPGRSSAP